MLNNNILVGKSLTNQQPFVKFVRLLHCQTLHCAVFKRRFTCVPVFPCIHKERMKHKYITCGRIRMRNLSLHYGHPPQWLVKVV